jgi:hypothetical protein
MVFLYKTVFFVAVSQNEHHIYFSENPWGWSPYPRPVGIQWGAVSFTAH